MISFSPPPWTLPHSNDQKGLASPFWNSPRMLFSALGVLRYGFNCAESGGTGNCPVPIEQLQPLPVFPLELADSDKVIPQPPQEQRTDGKSACQQDGGQEEQDRRVVPFL